MKHLFIISAILLLTIPTAVYAATSFVIEANGAQPEVGIQVQGDTQITIGEGGHIVLMTDAGQMIRQDGPYNGSADDILANQIASSDSALEGGLLGSLLELAEVSKQNIPNFVYIEAPIGEDPDKRNYIVSNAKLEATGWMPQCTIDEGIRELIKGYRMIRNDVYSNL